LLTCSSALLASCDTLGLESGGGDGGGATGEGDGDGALDQIDLSGDEDSGEENGDLEFDFSTSCPQEQVEFNLTLDYQLNINESNGFIRESTNTEEGVTIMIQDSRVWMNSVNPLETISGTIEGQIGDCEVGGDFELSLIVGGSCQNGIATLDITGTYESYQREITCDGEVVENYTVAYTEGPSVEADFNIEMGGYTTGWSQDFGVFSAVYEWTLSPLFDAQAPSQ
jgi:hypothetical protein